MTPTNRYADDPRQAAADQEVVEFARMRADAIGVSLRLFRDALRTQPASPASAELRELANGLDEIDGTLKDYVSDLGHLEREIEDALGAVEAAEEAEHDRQLRRDYHHGLGVKTAAE